MKKNLGLFLCIIGLLLVSCEKTSTVENPSEKVVYKPKLSGLVVSEVTFNSIKLSANVSYDGESSVISRGFLISKTAISNPDHTWGINYSCDDGVGQFSKTITDLTPSTQYFYVAYASNQAGVVYSAVLSSETLKEIVAPELSEPNVRNISESSAELFASILNNGGSDITACGFRLSKTTTANPDSEWGTDYGCATDSTEFSQTIDDMTPDTQYFYVAYVSNQVGTTYSDVCSFKTSKEVVVPELSKPDVRNITDSSAELFVSILNDGGSDVTARGFKISKTPKSNADSDWDVDYDCGTGTGEFVKQIEELKENTTYYYVAYAQNAKGVSYTDVSTFSTTKATTIPTVDYVEHSNVTNSSVKLSAVVINLGGSDVIERGFIVSKVLFSELDINKGTKYNCGSGLGFFNKVVEDLEGSRIYCYAAYALNSKGYAYSEVKSFTTAKEPDVIPVELLKPTVQSVQYSSTGFIHGGAKYNYRMTYNVQIQVRGYQNIKKAGFRIGGATWSFNNVDSDGMYIETIQTHSNSSPIIVTVTSHAIMQDGTEYIGNKETVYGEYIEGGGDYVGNKLFSCSNVRVELNPSTYLQASYNSAASTLRTSGILVYKDGSRYYWKDINGMQHTVVPNTLYSNCLYMSDRSLIGTKIHTAYLYFSFSFTPF